MWKSQTKGSQGAGSKRRQPKVIVATVNKKRLIICPQNDWTHSPLTSCKLKSLLMFDVVNKSWLVDPQQRRNHLQGYVHLTVAWLSQTSLLYTNRGGFRKKWQLFTCTRKLSSTCSEGFARKHGLLLSVSIDNYTCIICRQDGRRPCLFLSAENDMILCSTSQPLGKCWLSFSDRVCSPKTRTMAREAIKGMSSQCGGSAHGD